jgi:redox-sensitive bicupin YhaK (pirin superfamily)
MPDSELDRTPPSPVGIELVIAARHRDLGNGFMVRRLLPSIPRRMVGPFIFLDHMGPVALPAGQGVDVLPHPHVGLATVTYLFEGETLHRDSLGSEQLITPGAVNWMTAGRGIVHSERTSAASRLAGPRLHGLQLWVALPLADEETNPSFQHTPAADIPELSVHGTKVRVMAGTAFGVTSPVKVCSDLYYVEAELAPGADVPVPDEYSGRAVYVVSGALSCDGTRYGDGTMLVLQEHARPNLKAAEASRVVALGGAELDGDRHIWWNFVSSSIDRIERAKTEWRQHRFPLIPGDEHEFVPLPPDVGRPR